MYEVPQQIGGQGRRVVLRSCLHPEPSAPQRRRRATVTNCGLLAGLATPAADPSWELTHIILRFRESLQNGWWRWQSGSRRSLLRVLALQEDSSPLKVIVSIGGGGLRFLRWRALTTRHAPPLWIARGSFTVQILADGVISDLEYPDRGVAGIKSPSPTPRTHQNYQPALGAATRKTLACECLQGRIRGDRYRSPSHPRIAIFDPTEMAKLRSISTGSTS